MMMMVMVMVMMMMVMVMMMMMMMMMVVKSGHNMKEGHIIPFLQPHWHILYTHMYTTPSTHIHLHTHLHTYTSTPTCTCTSTPIYTHAPPHPRAHAPPHPSTHMHLHTHLYMHLHTHLHTCTSTPIYIYTCTSTPIYTHTPPHPRAHEMIKRSQARDHRWRIPTHREIMTTPPEPLPPVPSHDHTPCPSLQCPAMIADLTHAENLLAVLMTCGGCFSITKLLWREKIHSTKSQDGIATPVPPQHDNLVLSPSTS